jgi:hypothetical protein
LFPSAPLILRNLLIPRLARMPRSARKANSSFSFHSVFSHKSPSLRTKIVIIANLFFRGSELPQSGPIVPQPRAASRCAPTIRRPGNGRSGGSMGAILTAPLIRRSRGASKTASEPSIPTLRSTGSRSARGSFGPTLREHPPAGNKPTHPMQEKRGRRIGPWSSSGPREPGKLPRAGPIRR